MRASTISIIFATGVVALAPTAGAQQAQRLIQRPGVTTRTPPMGGPGAPNATGATGGTAGSTGTGATGTGTGGTGTGTAGTGTGTGAPGAAGKTQADTSSLPQFEQGVEYTPRSPNYKVSLSLEDADLAELVRVIGQLTGKRFIFGGKVRNIKASIFAPQKVTVAEAYQAFLSILETNGLTVVPHGRFLKIVETGGIASQATPTYGSDQSTPAEDRYVTRMLRLQHAPADEVANVLGHFKSKDGDITVASSGNLLIITDTGSNIRRMMQIVEEVDVGAAGDQMWIEPIHYASAADIASRINELFGIGGGKGGEKGGAAAGVGVGALHVTKVVADDRSNSVIIVATEPAYTRILEFIKRLDVPQTGEGEIHVLPLQHADAIELTKTLKELVEGGAGHAGGGAPGAKGGAPADTQVFEGAIKISADKATNSIVVTSSLRDFASLRAVVDRLDQPRRQVFIEAVIMDLSVSRSTQLGLNFHGGGLSDLGLGAGQSLLFGGLNPLETVSPLGSDPSLLQGLALGLRGPGIPGTESFSVTGQTIPAFGVILQALTTAGDTDVLSTPHILATDNIKAEINVGQNIPLQTNIGGLPSSGATGAAGSTSSFLPFGFGASPARQDVGTKITITPHLNESNEVRLELAEEISEAGDAVGQLGVVPITKRTATTQLVVKDQQTVVIGGLMRNRIAHQETKIPVLGDIPLLGVLFRQTTNTVQKSNLLLVLTPYIIREQADLRAIFERKMQERQEFLDRYFVFSEDHDYKPPKDYSRTNGLLEDIKSSYRSLDEKERIEELLRPKDVLGHSPSEPIDLPQQMRSGGIQTTTTQNEANPAGNAAAARPIERRERQPANITVTPPVRNVERIER
ncbi:MAG TPA: type II secretion system secretin GspD [Polyangiaceae bacterium]|jgi:general secretion pathway protein D